MLLSLTRRSGLLLSSITWSHHHACFASFQITVHQCKPQTKESLFWAETRPWLQRHKCLQKSFVLLSAIHSVVTLPFCSTTPIAALCVCKMAEGYEQGRIRSEILFLPIQHSSWLRQTSPWHIRLLQFLQKNQNSHVFPDTLVQSNKAIILLSTNWSQ